LHPDTHTPGASDAGAFREVVLREAALLAGRPQLSASRTPHDEKDINPLRAEGVGLLETLFTPLHAR
jgi:hypothetical protein